MLRLSFDCEISPETNSLELASSWSSVLSSIQDLSLDSLAVTLDLWSRISDGDTEYPHQVEDTLDTLDWPLLVQVIQCSNRLQTMFFCVHGVSNHPEASAMGLREHLVAKLQILTVPLPKTRYHRHIKVEPLDPGPWSAISLDIHTLQISKDWCRCSAR